MTLAYDSSGGWPEQFDLCPYDRDFVDWLSRHVGGRVLHVGTGLHHYVGRNADGNVVLGWTASPEEHAAYVRMVIEEPQIAERYQCLFGDIHQIATWMLPLLTVASLPHLCEFTDHYRPYASTGDAGVLNIVLGRLRPGGHLVTYPGSAAYDRAFPLLSAARERGEIVAVDEWLTLDVWRRTNR